MLAVSFGMLLAAFEKGQQRTWDHIPKRNCMVGYSKLYKKRGSNPGSFLVVMRNACQVTNQSSHGELSFHHNPHLWLCRGLGLSTSRVIRREGSRLKNAAHPTYCHCCELCALKQKPGALLENAARLHPRVVACDIKKQIPTADRTHHRIRSPSI